MTTPPGPLDSLLAHQAFGPPSAPPLVLLHPIATRSDIWALQIPAWGQRWRVIAIDLPGHGASLVLPHPESLADMAERVVHTLDALGVARFALVGLSWGGMVAQALALQHADRLVALVLAHTGARTTPQIRAVWQERIVAAHLQGMAAQVEPTLDRWFTAGFRARSPLTVAWVAQQIRGTSAIGHECAARAIQQLDHLDRLHAVRTPTLVVSGECDTAAPVALGAAMCERLPNARQVVIDGVAHFGHIERPVEFTEAVGAFLMAHASG